MARLDLASGLLGLRELDGVVELLVHLLVLLYSLVFWYGGVLHQIALLSEVEVVLGEVLVEALLVKEALDVVKRNLILDLVLDVRQALIKVGVAHVYRGCLVIYLSSSELCSGLVAGAAFVEAKGLEVCTLVTVELPDRTRGILLGEEGILLLEDSCCLFSVP